MKAIEREAEREETHPTVNLKRRGRRRTCRPLPYDARMEVSSGPSGGSSWGTPSAEDLAEIPVGASGAGVTST